MKFKEVATSNASTEAKVAALALLLDKELIKLADTVLNVKKLEGPKGEQGIQGPKGEQGDRGFDGTNGKDGADGKDGKDGEDGKQGVGVADAKIDFDGSLVITLTDGTEINAGDVVPLDTAEKIRVIGNGGGTSQSVLDAIDAINAIISTYGTMALQDDTAVDINGGAIDGTAIGASSASTGTFTTLTATGQTSLGGAAGSEALRALTTASGNIYWTIKGGIGSSASPELATAGNGSTTGFNITNHTTGGITFKTATFTSQFAISHTASAVNYVQVTGSSTSNWTSISSQGSDTNITQAYVTKGSGQHVFGTNGASSNTQLRISHVSSAINYATISGGQSSGSPIFGVAGTDTNISQVFQSKGTGAIDLAAGSRGVNISNGGTVTALTVTGGGGGGYTTLPSVAITAPTTAGGVQATASINANLASPNPTVVSGGTGYTVGDVLTIVGGTFSVVGQLTVSTVSAGVITAVTISTYGTYTVLPTNPVSVTGGTGSSATFNVNWGVRSLTITNAGSGYVEQPTVSFSGGGGSGAAAYATVGSGTTVKSIGSTMSFTTAGGEQVRVLNTNAANYMTLSGSGTGSAISLGPAGTDGGIATQIFSKGSGTVEFWTNGGNQRQMIVSHTASAVNYVQVTGATTSGNPFITAQGSDTTIGLSIASKGTSFVYLRNAGTTVQFSAGGTSSAVNYLNARGNAAGTGPQLEAVGSDTNIDLSLTPKGTGNVRFGTLTASADVPITGYITIKDSGGTVRKLAVIA